MPDNWNDKSSADVLGTACLAEKAMEYVGALAIVEFEIVSNDFMMRLGGRLERNCFNNALTLGNDIDCLDSE